MMLKFLLPFVFLGPFVLIHTIKADVSSFQVDELGNIWTVSPRYIEKRDPSGKVLFRTSELEYGIGGRLDLTNPLMPFVHFPELGKVVVFDNTLSRQGETIDLFAQPSGQFEFIAGSRGDAFWLWDVNTSELIRVNRQFQRLASTGNLGVLLGLSIYPTQITERGQYVYLIDQEDGILVFDIYANYMSRIPVSSPYPVQVSDDHLAWVQDSLLYVLAPDRITSFSVELPAGEFSGFQFSGNHLYLHRPGGIEVFRYVKDVKN